MTGAPFSDGVVQRDDSRNHTRTCCIEGRRVNGGGVHDAVANATIRHGHGLEWVMVLHMHRVHPGGAGAAELAGGPASVVKLVREPMGGAPGWGSCDWRTAGVAEGAFVGRREGQVRVCGDGWTVALQDPEVPAGGAKPEVHSPSASIKVRWDWDCNWNWSSESARRVVA